MVNTLLLETAMDLAALNAKFALPHNALTITTGNGGLPCVDVNTPAVSGRVYFQGAHVTAWKPKGTADVLWTSAKSNWEAGKPIRGGVPLCFPWFGPNAADATLPLHGFARLLPWELEATRAGDAGKVALVMVLRSSPATKTWWPHDFELRHRITFGDQLIMKLEVLNTGSAPFEIEEAQHTYFTIGDARQVQITGCEDVEYVDKVDNKKIKTQEGLVTFSGETDRVYTDARASNILIDPVLKRRITIQKTDSRSTVIWNPWINKSKAMPDFGDDEWTGMCCIETANVADAAVTVNPGQTHQMRTILSVDPTD